MADKPSRALVLYGDGLARFISPAQTHLHSFASRASCVFLALPHSPPPPPPSENEDLRVIREFAEILDSNEAYKNLDVKRIREDKPQETCAFPSVAERFMGMKAAIITDNLSLKSFGSMLGFNAFSWNEMSENDNPVAESSPLVKLLGFQDGKILDTSGFELVFVHVGANTVINGFKDIELVNHLVGDLLDMSQSESDVGSRLHTSIILSYGATVGDNDLEFSVSNTNHKNGGDLLHLCPRQSYMTKAGKLRENIRLHCPMLLAQYQNAVTRMDMVKTFSFRDFTEHGGNLTIPADRFLHEVAFKLWKAPKYGA